MKRRLIVPCILTLTVAASLARAEEPPAPPAGSEPGGAPHAEGEAAAGPAHEEHEAHEAAEPRFHIGVYGTALASIAESTGGRYGGGLFFSVAAIPGRLELELSGRVLGGNHGVVDVPIELLVKLPFHLTERIHPFVGIGPALVVAIEAERTVVEYGGAAVAGTDIELTRRLSLVAEINYNLLYHDAVIHELGGSIGMQIGF